MVFFEEYIEKSRFSISRVSSRFVMIGSVFLPLNLGIRVVDVLLRPMRCYAHSNMGLGSFFTICKRAMLMWPILSLDRIVCSRFEQVGRFLTTRTFQLKLANSEIKQRTVYNEILSFLLLKWLVEYLSLRADNFSAIDARRGHFTNYNGNENDHYSAVINAFVW